MIVESLRTRGFVYERDWTYECLPNTHAILHCFYDFDSPPLGFWARRVPPDLYAVVMDEAVICLKTQGAYCNAWGDWGPGGGNPGYEDLDPTRCFQFGVNTIIYALTREGSITHRVVSSLQ